MKPSGLVKSIESLDVHRLCSLLLELAALREENAVWLQGKLGGKSAVPEVLLHYKKRIRHAFLMEPINLRGAKQTIQEFKRLCDASEHVLDLMVFYIETGTKIENGYGDLYDSFYSSMETIFKNIVALLNKQTHLIATFKPRLVRIIELSNEGWGHRETLEEIYEHLK